MSIVLFLCPLESPAAKDIQTFLNAPAFQCEYEVVFKASHQGSRPVDVGSMKYTITMDRILSGAITLGLRNGGANLSMLRLSVGSTDESAASIAEQQQKMTDLIMRTDDLANWIDAGPAMDENASAEEQQAAMMAHMNSGTARLDYVEVVTGTDLVDETGAKFNVTMRTTRKGTGKVVAGTPVVEVDAKAKRYLVTLPHSFGDQSANALKEEIVTRTEAKGQEPTEERKTRETRLDSFPAKLVIDDPKMLLGDILFFEGTFDPAAGKISGEHTIKAHYMDNANTIPGTLTVRYTLTPR